MTYDCLIIMIIIIIIIMDTTCCELVWIVPEHSVKFVYIYMCVF